MFQSLLAAIPAITSITSGISQQKEGGKLRQDAKLVKKEKIRPEFLQRKTMEEMAALQGLPSTQTYREQLGQQSSNALSNIQKASTNPAATIAAMGAALAEENQRYAQQIAREGEAKMKAQERVGQQVQRIGEEERRLELEQTRKKENIFAAADQLEKAGTANIQRGVSGIASAATMGFGGFGGGGNNTTTTTDPQITAPSAGTQTVSTNPSQAQTNFWNQGGGSLQPNQASGFAVLPENDKIAYAKTKSLLAPQATDADYQQLLKDPAVIKMLEESYGK